VAELNDKSRFPRLLVCEGPEDKLFFHRLIQVRNLPQFHILASGGKSNFSQEIRRFQLERPRTYQALKDILIVADNDEEPETSFKNVCSHIDRLFGNGTAPRSPQERTKTKPSVTVFMIPWTNQKGHLEKLCLRSANTADGTIGNNVTTFMALIGADRWNNESRFAKAWLRTNLAARCETDPFVALGHVFSDPKYQGLIPVSDSSFKQIHDFLTGFA
jgi:hypothetical protein